LKLQGGGACGVARNVDREDRPGSDRLRVPNRVDSLPIEPVDDEHRHWVMDAGGIEGLDARLELSPPTRTGGSCERREGVGGEDTTLNGEAHDVPLRTAIWPFCRGWGSLRTDRNVSRAATCVCSLSNRSTREGPLPPRTLGRLEDLRPSLKRFSVDRGRRARPLFRIHSACRRGPYCMLIAAKRSGRALLLLA
jgi:hypothetical protein